MRALPISKTKILDLQRRMNQLGIRDEDLVEEFIRGSGPGGQKINKTSVAVLLSHPPTGLSVRCQHTRSQALNRFLARRLLVEKLEEKIFKEKSERQKLIEKIRRQKRRRSRRAQEKILQAKKHQGFKKVLRKRPSTAEY